MKRLALSLIAALAACATDKPATTDTTSVTVKQELIPKGETPETINKPEPPASEEPRGGQWDVTSSGIGELKAGMGIEEANIVTKNALDVPAKISDCDYIKMKNAPKGVALMFEKGIFSRVDVTSGSVKTVQGVGIGDTEEKINSVYAGQTQVNPAKYGSGHTIVVTPKSGGNNRIVFETDGKKVTKFRSGREPAVEYVEGCG